MTLFKTCTLKLALAFSALSCFSACSVMPPQAMTHTPQFEPVYPLIVDAARPATGAIYVGRQSDSWFGKGRNFQVGDVITVLLNESTQAARTQNANVSRSTSQPVWFCCCLSS